MHVSTIASKAGTYLSGQVMYENPIRNGENLWADHDDKYPELVVPVIHKIQTCSTMYFLTESMKEGICFIQTQHKPNISKRFNKTTPIICLYAIRNCVIFSV